MSTRYDGNYVLLGVVSFGESQCGLSDGRPGVYTNVQSHVSWIRRVIGEETRAGRAVPRCTTVDGRRCILPFRYKVYFSYMNEPTSSDSRCQTDSLVHIKI